MTRNNLKILNFNVAQLKNSMILIFYGHLIKTAKKLKNQMSFILMVVLHKKKQICYLIMRPKLILISIMNPL